MMPFFFSAMTMGAVSTCALGVITEVRRQLREIPGIMDRTQKPDYARLVAIVTGSSIHAMIGPGGIALLVPLCAGIWFKSSFLGGMLIANTCCGFMLSTMMAISGGSWDNAKKYVEAGHFGGKHSFAHKATVVGGMFLFVCLFACSERTLIQLSSPPHVLYRVDTIGDPFKDTSGPSINILIKLVTYTGVVLAPVYREQASIWWAAFIIFFGALAILLPIMVCSPQNIRTFRNWIKSKREGGSSGGDEGNAEDDDLEAHDNEKRHSAQNDQVTAVDDNKNTATTAQVELASPVDE